MECRWIAPPWHKWPLACKDNSLGSLWKPRQPLPRSDAGCLLAGCCAENTVFCLLKERGPDAEICLFEKARHCEKDPEKDEAVA